LNESIIVTFDQQYATENQNVEFINSYHPLIIAIANYLENKKLHINQVYQFTLPKEFVNNDEVQIKAGDYLMCVYKIIVERVSENITKRFEYLRPIVLDANSEDYLFLAENEANYLFGQSQQYSNEIESFLDFNNEIIEAVRPQFAEQLDQLIKQYEEDENIKLESFKQRNLKQIEKYYESRIDRLVMQIEELESNNKILPLRKKELENLRRKYIEKKESLKRIKLFLDNSLVSISYVQIS
jgi:hypothetical protein